MIVGFVPGTGLLHRAHPLTGLAIALAVAVLAFVLPAPEGPAVLTVVLVLLALIARLPRALVTALAFAAPFWVFLVLIHVVLGDNPGRAAAVGGQITAILLGFLLVLASVHPGRLVDALLTAGVPFSVAYLLAATLQSVPRLQARAGAILDAQRCRGLPVGGSLWNRAKAVVPLSIPLVLGALAEVDERALALEARGAGSPARHTPLNPPPDSMVDRAVRWSLLFVVLLALGVRIAS